MTDWVGRISSRATRLDLFLLLLGPVCLGVTWLLLPGGMDEGVRHRAEDPVSGVVAELVGYAVTPAGKSGPLLVGRGADADVRLHHAPVARHAAVLFPPQPDRPSWLIAPAAPGLTLSLASAEDGSVDPHGQSRERVTKTSIRFPIDDRDDRWIVGCQANGMPAALPPFSRISVRLDRETGEHETWGMQVDRGSDTPFTIVPPWGKGFSRDGLWLEATGFRHKSFRLGVIASLDGACALSGSCKPPSPTTIYPVGKGGDAVEIFGPLELKERDVLAIGRTRFLIRGRERTEDRTGGLDLLHVRDPKAPSFLRASSGADAYHPNRTAMWNVPFCEGEFFAGRSWTETLTGSGFRAVVQSASSERGVGALTLAIQPPQDAREAAGPSPAELPVRDRAEKRRIREALVNYGVSHQLFPSTAAAGPRRALVSLCAARREAGGIEIRILDSTPGVVLARSPEEETEPVPGNAVSIGSVDEPVELLMNLGGNLIRIAPAAAARISQHTRCGLAGYLSLMLLIQAVPLTVARRARRATLAREPALEAEIAWPADLGGATLQQLAGIAITCLLFAGAGYQLFLGLHPQLAGKPDYAQAFLQGTVLVSAVLTAAAGFATGGVGLAQRCALALGGIAAALGAGALWWWWDGIGLGEGLWLTGEREVASLSGPVYQLLAAGAGCLVGSLVVLVLARLAVASRAAAGAGARIAFRRPSIVLGATALAGLGLAAWRRSALSFELALLAGLAWYAAVYWAFARGAQSPHTAHLRRRSAVLSFRAGILILVFLVLFFWIGSRLPTLVSLLLIAAGVAVTLGGALPIIREAQLTTLRRMLAVWVAALGVGTIFACFFWTDMGSVAAWVPAILAGFFLWLIRPEEHEERQEEPKKARAQLLLALGSGLILLGLLDLFTLVVNALPWHFLERPQQRLALAEDISYVTAGEWITQVRWLASRHESAFYWVPNLNSDIAVFGLAANFGSGVALLCSLALLLVAFCAGLAADQALREARALAPRHGVDERVPTLYRALGLLLGMVAVLLSAQWLVHLATGVVLHLPITGLVFPWISHGNTSHLLFTAAVMGPLCAFTALAARSWNRGAG